MDRAQLTFQRSTAPAAAFRPILVLIPGGPGLSSESLGSIDELLKAFDVARMDPPGTGGLPDSELYTFPDMLESMTDALIALERPLVFMGHSFGSIYAAQLCFRPQLNVTGLVAVAPMISTNSIQGALQAFPAHASTDSKAAERAFGEAPTNENFTQWLTTLAPVYFINEQRAAGIARLQADKVSAKAFAQLFPYVLSTEHPRLLPRLKYLEAPKLLIAGESDLICPGRQLQEDAAAIGASFEIIPGASHFVTFEQPAAFAKIIEKTFA